MNHGRHKWSRAAACVAAFLTVFALAGLAAVPASAATAHKKAAVTDDGHFKVHKINVMGEWAHPDDDTSIIGPCGVWHQRYGIRCGVIQVTRGEGGGNAVGPEHGPALGLRRENEDRAAHYRSGTTDIFYLDKLDFFYNQSAPLTNFFWGHDDTLAREVRIIRETEPDIYIGWPPFTASGHGNHQEAGRLIWEGTKAAADPAMFPDQLTGPHALRPWQIKKVYLAFGDTNGSGGTNTANCTTGFVPAADNLFTVAGVWNGYASPYRWPAGNLQGQPAGTTKTWAQVAAEGSSAYPTQSRTMYQSVATPSCNRFAMGESFVPFQPNVWPDGTVNPAAGKDNAAFFGATIPDPGGLPLGTLLYETFSSYFNVAGQPFHVTVHAKSGKATLGRASVALHVPTGWTVSPAAQRVGPITSTGESTATFTVTPSASASQGQYKISAMLTDHAKSGYTDNVMQLVPPVQGQFKQWGKFKDYDNWAEQTAPQALKLGLSPAVQPIGAGETVTVPIQVTNDSTKSQTGRVSLSLPAGFSADATAKPYGPLAAGTSTTVDFRVTNTNLSIASSTSYPVDITTSYSAPAGSAQQTLSLDLVPSTTIAQASRAPTLDGHRSSGEYPGPALDLSKVWQGSACTPAGVDCGTAAGAKPGDVDSTYAKVSWYKNALYFFVHVRDDTQSYGVTPAQCVGHWLADSVEIGVDARGNSSDLGPLGPGLPQVADTATTFKTGIFPFTNDPNNTLGNAHANGPCWERDADNHQGYSNGPLARTVPQAPNAPGMKVVSTATWDGNNDPTKPHPYKDGYYNVEVKIPFADLPAAVGPTGKPPTAHASTNAIDPEHMGVDVIVYDEDNQLHIDQSTRLGWSAWNSVQSDPYHWGHAYLPGYTPPAGASTIPTAPIYPATAAKGVDSPQTVYQSARNGVPIAGLAPAPANDQVRITNSRLRARAATLHLTATGAGTAHVFLWAGSHSYIPVFTSSCASDPFEPGFTPCSASDGAAAAWGIDMGGHLIADKVVALSAGRHRISVPVDAAGRHALGKDGSILVSFQTADDAVQALALPVDCDRVISARRIAGSVKVRGGVTCLAGGVIAGRLSIRRGASFAAVGGRIRGLVTSIGARSVTADGTTVAGPMLIARTTGTLALRQVQLHGPVALVGNQPATGPPVVSNSKIRGPLFCIRNSPAPIDEALPNVVKRGATGQCGGL